MTLLYPLGLLGLIGIPILIVIYIIKSKYTEQTVSSTYLWTLSERFLKRKNPISRITGIISLILQILAVTVLSLAIAHPVITLPDAANEYCFILDATGSMNIVQEGKTRFELAKEKIASILKNATDGSLYSLVYVSDASTVVFDKVEDKEQALTLLSDLTVSCATSNFSDALGTAQRYFNENPAVKTYLVTDKAYEAHDNIELVQISDKADNYALSDLSYSLSGGVLTVSGYVYSYESDATLTVSLYVDGDSTALSQVTTIVRQGQPAQLQISGGAEEGFSSLRVVIENQDALALDNEAILFNPVSEKSYKTLLISERPFFLKSVLSAVVDAGVEVVTPNEFEGKSGYGLYIFDTYTPSTLPKDGAVWLIAPQGSLDETGFSVQGIVELDDGDSLLLSDSSASTVRNLSMDLSGQDIYISKYVKCGLYRNFTTLFSYKGNPIVFAGANSYGNRQVVIAFDLHDSNLPLLLDFAVLIRNLVQYSFPTVLEDISYYCGEEMEINVVANCESIRVDSPLGNVMYLETDNATVQYPLTEAGVYTVTLMVSGSEKQFSVFSALPKEERAPTVTEDAFSLQGEAGEDGIDGKFDPLVLLFVILAVIFIADWVVYCYEKYQLQ